MRQVEFAPMDNPFLIVKNSFPRVRNTEQDQGIKLIFLFIIQYKF